VKSEVFISLAVGGAVTRLAVLEAPVVGFACNVGVEEHCCWEESS
jgi:hypothetical protein